MKSRLRTSLFLPFMLIILMFSLSVYLCFSAVSQQYVRYTAEKNLQELAHKISMEASQVYSETDISSLEPEKERQYAKELLNQIKDLMKNGGMEVDLLVLNSKYEAVYPPEILKEEFGKKIYEHSVNLIKNDLLSSMEEIEVFGNTFLLHLYELESYSNIRAKYYILYAKIPDMSQLLSSAWKLVFVITALFLTLAGLAAWFLAKSISRPIEALCLQAGSIGKGAYPVLNDEHSIMELETLKEAINEMTRQLKEAEEQKNLFFQNVSHDLRTPLAAISGYAQGMQCGIIDDTKKAGEIILSESLRMTDLVESILMLSKMDSRSFPLHITEIQTDELLEQQTQIMQGACGGKNLEVGSTVPCIIYADPDLLIRILQNVLSNCIRYARKTVSISAKEEEQFVRIIVEDDGPGIPLEELPHIFDRFFKGNSGQFGIGLSIAKSGMNYMNGDITIENKAAPCHGAVYSLFLPKYPVT